MRQNKINTFLVGERFMREQDPGVLLNHYLVKFVVKKQHFALIFSFKH